MGSNTKSQGGFTIFGISGVIMLPLIFGGLNYLLPLICIMLHNIMYKGSTKFAASKFLNVKMLPLSIISLFAVACHLHVADQIQNYYKKTEANKKTKVALPTQNSAP